MTAQPDDARTNAAASARRKAANLAENSERSVNPGQAKARRAVIARREAPKQSRAASAEHAARPYWIASLRSQ
jgi:hypothetical protein